MGQHVFYRDGNESQLVHVSRLEAGRNYWIIHPDFDDAELKNFRPTYGRVLGSEIPATLKDLARKSPKRWGINDSHRPIQTAIVEDATFVTERIAEVAA